MIQKSEAELLREKLRPAFAGFVTDGNISNRDVLATIMDLIVRGNIGIDSETQTKPVRVHKIYLIKTSTLLPFEQKFVAELFSSGSELTASEVKEKILSERLHRIIERNSYILRDIDNIRQILLFFDKKGKETEVSRVNYSDDDVYLEEIDSLEKLQDYAKEAKKDFRDWAMIFAFSAPILIYISFFSSMQIDFSTLSGEALFLIIMFIIGYIAFFFLSINKGLILRRTRRQLNIRFNDTILPLLKEKYDQLFDFIKQYPLEHQRLFNEFMPHAVAFGLDTTWNESFGIEKEILIKSKQVKELT